ncbi:MAG: hypothetical protein MUQ10_04125 [Anaerolineae bacterium]|nr:hypothetical protein [Anaerolineae bacterium]
MDKIRWAGRVISVQPRIGLTRSFDQRHHSYSGYCLILNGIVDDEEREFSVGIGNVAQAKHQFQVGDELSGEGVPVAYPRREPVEFYRASKLKVLLQGSCVDAPPPWLGIPPDLETYRARGHRRLAARTYATRCRSCLWGCRMPVTMIIDQWEPSKKRYRHETFCYGPKSCSFYKPGPTRKVPGRQGMTWEEEDWVDEDATSHRGWDE